MIGTQIVQDDAVIGVICREEMTEVVRRSDGDPRWCFTCRKTQAFDFVVVAPTAPSYYGPSPSIRCGTCGTSDGDCFPGRYREWEG